MLTKLAKEIKDHAHSIGLSDIGITDIDLSNYSDDYQQWIDDGHHGSMDYMAKHGEKRWLPDKLIEGTMRVISFRLDYWREEDKHHYVSVPKTFNKSEVDLHPSLALSKNAYISRYALGRDYHKVLRKKGKQLGDFITDLLQNSSEHHEFNYRVFVDSAPVLEKPIAEKAGLGWIGKHSNLINKEKGSWFFLGEIYTNIPLPIDQPKQNNHCGSCTRCIQACPTNAIIKPYVVDANLCISYLTIEHHGAVPVKLRKAMGNRIYGCDDCQLVCPWNKFAELSQVEDFKERHGLASISLIECFLWDEATFLKKTEGSAIRRIGYLKWLSNIAIALGNAHFDQQIIDILEEKLIDYCSSNESSPNFAAIEVLAEHINWAIEQQKHKGKGLKES